MPYVDQRAALIDLYDVEGVQVFRGPQQTTTFGRNAESGTMSIFTPVPGNDLRARGVVWLGTHDEQVYQASAAGPLVRDQAFVGVAAIQSSRDGYIRNTFLDNDLDDRDLFGGRGRLVLRPLQGLDVELIGEGQRARDGSQAWILLDQPDPFTVAYDTPGSSRLDSTVGALRLRYEWSWLTLTSVTGRRDFDSHDNTFDLDFSPAPIAVLQDDYRLADWTQEVRAAFERPGSRWRGHVGLFFEDKSTEPDLTVRLRSPVALENRQTAHLAARTWAGFGQIGLTLSPGVHAVAGLRVESSEVQMRREHVMGPPGQRPTPVVPTIRLQEDSLAWLPHVRLAWTPARDARYLRQRRTRLPPGRPVAAQRRPGGGALPAGL